MALPPLSLPPLAAVMMQQMASEPSAARKRVLEPSKGKSSVRAKSGCWTCRIRRKKCDEMRTPEGFCQTCVRLRLECLGWGSRRPDWMREKNNVIERREKIKDFLAQNGMIKGHAGSITRGGADNPPPILRLGFDGVSIVSSGQSRLSSPSLSPTSDRDRQRALAIDRDNTLLYFANVASDAQPYGAAQPPILSPPLMIPSGMPRMAPEALIDPSAASVPLDDSLAYIPDFSPDGSTAVPDSAHGVVGMPASPWISPFVPPDGSSFGRLYNTTIDAEDELSSPETATTAPTDMVLARGGSYGANAQFVDPMTGATIPSLPIPARWLGDMPHSQFVFHYMNNVLPIQYLLADQTTIRQWTYNLAVTSESTRSAVCLLAALHQHCMSQMNILGNTGSTTELDVFYSNTRNALRSAKTYTEGDAMASLHVISSFLFAGGRGPWHEYLDIASKWVSTVLMDPRYPHPRDALLHASESARFIIRATFWFDVWSSCSQLRQPHFLHVYRDIFGSSRGSVEDDDPATGMLEVMGCSNENFLAMAEIAALAHWKEEQRKLGKLSYPRLVERGHDIEARFLLHSFYEPGDTSYIGRVGSAFLTTPDGVELRRKLVSNVFRASAKVYLHSVLSDGWPETPEIKAGVSETINCLKAVPGYGDASRVVVRSVVFSICICGCLTDDEDQRAFLLQQLDALGQEAEVLGNCFQAKKLMERVWEKRRTTGGEVRWRETMLEEGPGILLLA